VSANTICSKRPKLLKNVGRGTKEQAARLIQKGRFKEVKWGRIKGGEVRMAPSILDFAAEKPAGAPN